MSSPNFDPDEQKLRILFQELKQREAKRTPGFSRILHRALTEEQSAPSYQVRPLFALIGSVLLFLATIYAVEEYGDARDAASPTISDWHSPTAFLLHTPGEKFVAAVPEFGKPMIQFTHSFNMEDL